MILVDTSVLIDFLKGFQTEGRDKFEVVLHRKIPFGITSFILQEVLQGAASEKEFLLLKKYLLSQKFYHPKDPVDSFARAARIYMDCRKQGITIRSTIDCIIVQTTLEHDLFLLHNDSDFNAMVKVVPIKFY
jgi:predicted nucleic acid-binding protein